MTAAGLLLAGGAGRRMGRPKALVELCGEPLVRRALRALRDGGCAPLVVALGAAAGDVRCVLPDDAVPVEVPGWTEGMGASLRAGLAALDDVPDIPGDVPDGPPDGVPAARSVDAALVHLVDLPGITAAAVARLAAHAAPDVLARAAYRGRPGHPVLLGRDHWPGVRAAAVGDAGARGYLEGRAVHLVECGDVAAPDDVDTPEQLARHR